MEDKVVGPDGREMVRFHGVFVELPHIISAQVIQEERDRIHVDVVADAKFGSAEEQMIADRVRSQLGDVRVTVDRVSELSRNASGKVPAVISNIGSK